MELYALGLKIIIEKCNESSSKEVVDKLSCEMIIFIRDRTLRANTKLVELSFETLSKMLKSHGDLLIESHISTSTFFRSSRESSGINSFLFMGWELAPCSRHSSLI